MISFVVAVICLILGYKIYGKFIDGIFKPDNRKTPALIHPDGVDYIPMPTWKVFMIQFLNIAGTGPIFGAIMGMWYGPASYLWIVLGCIFGGAVHDYMSGMLSIRHDGVSLPEEIGYHLGKKAKNVMLVFTVILMLLVGSVFVLTPAQILSGIVHGTSLLFWIVLIFVYYFAATMLPIDKIIGKIYPIFAIAILFMGLGLMVVLLVKHPVLPEVWQDFGQSWLPKLGVSNPEPMFPALFVTIACGAISGFHATQSPMMARCLKNERKGRPIFFGSMIAEGIIALIWASVSSWFFFQEGWKDVCSAEIIQQFSESNKNITQFFPAPSVVMNVCQGWLGSLGGILALLGVVAAPITTGDTAMRSARLIIADSLHFDQKTIRKRIIISLPLFLASLALLLWQLDNPDSFKVIWQYFGWSNQTLSIFTLWAITVWLVRHKAPYFIGLVPALFMTAVSVSFVFVSQQFLGLDLILGYSLTAVAVLVSLVWFILWYKKQGNQLRIKQ